MEKGNLLFLPEEAAQAKAEGERLNSDRLAAPLRTLRTAENLLSNRQRIWKTLSIAKISLWALEFEYLLDYLHQNTRVE
ncbi:hypothetical protein Cylst_5796 [Cylindrospermum stagnale PCC 7417]|uniref:Uncharacterized protein n=1 Tax=Cylindrospermum stagnale PCC 7417 TaxID=56107 RepID=K9X5M9_9NOST|nr:hypothetical protein Cylst_5796 [Cylindrospermum stagnale PCC 7417]